MTEKERKRLRVIWTGMIHRCHNPEREQYKNYGARGIKVCQRWRNSFAAFLEDVGPRPSKKHSIDRIDNDGNYEPGNVRWATQRQQNRNTRVNRMLSHNGRTQCLTDWAEEAGLSLTVLHYRLSAGWSLSKALSTPSQEQVGHVTFEGKTQSITAWARQLAIPRKTLYSRFRSGWPVERALTTL